MLNQVFIIFLLFSTVQVNSFVTYKCPQFLIQFCDFENCENCVFRLLNTSLPTCAEHPATGQWMYITYSNGNVTMQTGPDCMERSCYNCNEKSISFPANGECYYDMRAYIYV